MFSRKVRFPIVENEKKTALETSPSSTNHFVPPSCFPSHSGPRMVDDWVVKENSSRHMPSMQHNTGALHGTSMHMPALNQESIGAKYNPDVDKIKPKIRKCTWAKSKTPRFAYQKEKKAEDQLNASSESVYEEGGDCLFSCRGGGICSSFTSSMNSTPRSPRYSFIDADRKRLFSCGKSPNMALAPIPPTASPRCSRQGIREGVKQLKYILSSHQQTAETSNLQPSPELQPESQVESPLSDASGERVKSGVEKMEKQDGSVAGVS